MATLATYADAREALRARDLRQALYDEGHHLMEGVIVNLHGDVHIARRRLENRLFRRDVFAWYERERIPAIIDQVLAPAIGAGHGDLLLLARRTMVMLSIDVAGVDLPSGSDAEFERFYALMDRLARASTVAHATGDKAAIIADGDDALAAFETEFFGPSRHRRQALVNAVARGERDDGDLPRDVLTTLLRNHDRLELAPRTVLREVAYFPWVGSHSTSNQFVHAMHHIFGWLADRPQDRPLLVDDSATLQRFVHESLRLHPASPVARRRALAAITLRSGITIADGEDVVIDIRAANRDPAAVGPDGDRFDPHRQMADGVGPWGLSFGHGAHACLGQELAGGLEPTDALEHQLLGSIVLMARAVLLAGARPDPDDPPTIDPATTRNNWGRYPVTLRSNDA